MVTCFTILGVVALILVAIALAAVASSYATNGDFFGWLFIGRPIIELAGKVAYVALLALCSLFHRDS